MKNAGFRPLIVGPGVVAPFTTRTVKEGKLRAVDVVSTLVDRYGLHGSVRHTMRRGGSDPLLLAFIELGTARLVMDRTSRDTLLVITTLDVDVIAAVLRGLGSSMRPLDVPVLWQQDPGSLVAGAARLGVNIPLKLAQKWSAHLSSFRRVRNVDVAESVDFSEVWDTWHEFPQSVNSKGQTNG